MRLRAPSSRELSYVKDAAAILQSVATVTAIVVAGFWFFLQREALPRATTTHAITSRRITTDVTWVHAVVRVTNIGRRKLELRKGSFWLEKILPLESSIEARLGHNEPIIEPTKAAVAWPRIGQLHEPPLDVSLEPGEDQEIDLEFVVPSSLATAKLYSYVENRPGLGWSKTTVFQVGSEQEVPK